MAAQIRNGDNGAMREFCSLYVPHLKAVCARYIADGEDVSDVLQETLISIVTHISDFHYLRQGSLKAWATRIAVNESLNFIRRNRRRELMFQEQYILYVFEDKSHQEIAQLLGCSANTSISQLHKAKNLLAKMIQTYHDKKRNER